MALCCRQRARRNGAGLQLADVLRVALPSSAALSPHHRKTLGALLRCHTEELGGHLYRCKDCGKDHFVAHGCRNRHCPSCQKTQAFDWLEKQSAALLPVPYFHIVFTLPHELNALISQNQRALYKLLFDAASGTLLEFGEGRLKAQIGITAVLHTWSQTLFDHYHLHCIVTGGGLAGKVWKSAGEHYLFPVRALSKVFKAKFRDRLKQLYADGALAFHGGLTPLAEKAEFEKLWVRASSRPWIVYCKKPFAGPQAVLAYLSRYTHRVAIGNGRILKLDPDAGTVSFSYKDYADRARRKKMELSVAEFLRRFCLHILPERFVKIRHYGLLGNRNRAAKIAVVRSQLGTPSLSAKNQTSIGACLALICPHCGSSQMLFVRRCEPSRERPEADDSS